MCIIYYNIDKDSNKSILYNVPHVQSYNIFYIIQQKNKSTLKKSLYTSCRGQKSKIL